MSARWKAVAVALSMALGVLQANAAAASFARERLLAYAIGQWDGYRPAVHHHLLASKLEAVERGEIRRLIVCMPPRHGKSMLTSEYFPAWYLGRNPERSIITATYGGELAKDFGRKVRNLTNSELHSLAFPGSSMMQDSKSSHRFNTARGGAYFAIGRGGSATGRGANLFLIDDPLKDREEAESVTIREKSKGWYRSTARTRLAKGGAIVLVMTRWHDDDLAGWVLREHAHEGWEVINLPALANANDPLGRQVGEALWPEMFPEVDLSSLKITLGSYEFSALYQGSPLPLEGGIFKLEWFANRYDVRPKAVRRRVQSWDTGQKAAEVNNPSVCTTWEETGNEFYLVHVHRARMEYPQLRKKAVELAGQFKPDAVLIEDKSSGQSLVQDLQQNTKLPIIPVEPEGDKVVRAIATSPLAESGRVRLPREAEWLMDYLEEVTRFPASACDDQVDSTTQALRWMSKSIPQETAAGPPAPTHPVAATDPILGMQS